jgi:hypothetical protein
MNQLRGQLLSSVCLCLALISLRKARADFNPVPLASSSFNYDIVVERTAPSPIGRATTASMDAGTNNTDASWYEIGFNTAAPTTGLPAAGSTFASAAAANHQYTMAPNYTTNNAMLIDGIVTNGTWTVTTPVAYTNLSFLTSGGHNGRTIAVLIHHQDGTTERSTFSSPDWFNGTSPAVTANGRVNVQTFLLDSVSSGNPRLYSRDISVINTTSPIISIDFTNASPAGGNVGIFAVSGTTPSSPNWTPIAVTGYNADMIVEAGAPQPIALATATTATMANGIANNGTTWFEAGYDPFLPTNGLPATNSTITSANQPDHHYKLPPSYTANDAAVLDATIPNANLIPVTPTSFSALSFLASSANGGTPINFSIQHLDGSTESGTFSVPDWFNNSPVAYNANGRILLDNRALTNENATPLNPRLYEPQVALNNTVSPVTNVALTYAGGGVSRAAFFAMSGSAGAVPPIIGSSPQSIIAYEGPDQIFSATIAGGTPPLLYHWQKGTNGVFANLTDGGNISGATTTNLTVSGTGLSDSADYRLVVSNVVGAVNSGVATLLVLSSLQDVTAPGDPITAVGGTSPVNEAVAHAIDNDTAKYLNFGGGTTPFSGTAGFVVTPSSGRSVVSVMRIYTANDFPDRDPADYLLEGSNDGGNTFAPIASGNLALPTERNDPGSPPNPLVEPMQQVSFSNKVSYTSYRLTFSHVKNPAGANSCQIGEVELLGTSISLSISVSPTFVNLYPGPGQTAQFTASVVPVDPSTTYQWQKSSGASYVSLVDNANISGSTTAVLMINNVSFNDAANYILVVSNSATIGSSSPSLLNVLSTLNDVTAPSDPITIFNGSSPAGEVVAHALDNVTDKYLNYGTSGTQLAPFVGPAGFIVTPAVGGTLVTGVRIYTANDAPERDPAGFKLEGSNDGGAIYSLITSNALTLPPDRNAAGSALDPLSEPNQEVRFNNAKLYTTYRFSVDHVKSDSAANSMQVADVELLGAVVPVLSIDRSGGSFTISSTLAGHLQSTTNIGNPVWLDAGAISGSVTITPLPGEPRKFYRVVVP